MRLPLLSTLGSLLQNDRDFVIEAIETLEHLTESENLKDEELDVIGELISNSYGAIEVQEMVEHSGTPGERRPQCLHAASWDRLIGKSC